MQKLGSWWGRLPTAIRMVLSVVIFVPFWLIVFGLILTLADEVAPDGDAGSGLNALVFGLFSLLAFMLLLRSVNRTHGGADRRRAFQSAIGTGVVSAEADRERLQEAVERFYAGRQPLLIIVGVFTVLWFIPIVLVVLDPPLEERDLRFVISQLVLLMLFAVPAVLFWRRRTRQMAALKEALQREGGVSGV